MAMAYGPDTGHPRAPRLPAWLGAPLAARTWREFCHLLLGLPLSLCYFALSVTALAVGAGLVVTFVGIPVLALGLAMCRGFGVVERARARAFLGSRVGDPEPARAEPGTGLTGAVWAVLKSGASWRHLLYAVLHMPWAVVAFSLAVTVWSTAWALFTYPLWRWSLPLHAGTDGIQVYGDGTRAYVLDSGAELAVTSGVGLVLVLLGAWLVRGLAAVDRALVRGLLGPSRLATRVVELESDRGVVVDVAAADLRRIERDLHDGAQARLVALAMDLGLAKEKATEDPRAAARMVEEAHDEVKLALQELRDLARGIHPAILTDRGLDAALSAVASRCTVPVTVGVDLPERPAAAVEGIAYFTVSELLQNVSKHARAHHATVDVWRTGDRLLIQVTDDGRGGADPTRGTGLAGLAERLDAVDGVLAVHSPEGGPTTVTAELPWRG
ncbi:sensor histidine kinase [Streptomyces roseolilacinus]|uniref:histidine kinase n=1 Tax=Streptomyces roseolilacinus TaxID=66904 RepID=A0A918EHX8_9ACTN|nr:sensor domain-containing protein [Streptomyces roseolilacinus]GGP91994.1 histidine kinase [Streptomyces roseolilacinus]